MNINELSKHEGKVVLLDLVTGMQVCTEVASVNELTQQVTVNRVIIFQIVQEPQDPSHPPSQMNPVVQKINAQPFGGPFTTPKDERQFDVAHILAAYTPIDAIEKAYLQATSGIEVVGAGAVPNIKGGPTGIVQ